MTLINALQAELFKYKNSLAKKMLFLFPIVLTLGLLGYALKFDTIAYNPWKFLGRFLFSFYAIFYPLLIAFVAFSQNNLEVQNRGLSHLHTLPIKRISIYSAKILVFYLYIFISVAIAYICFKLGCNLLGFINPDLGFADYNSNTIINLLFLKILITLFCIGIIQYVLSLFFTNGIVSLSVALFFTVFSVVFSKWEYIYLIPYGNIYSALSDYFMEDIQFFKKETIVSILYMVVFLFLGYYIYTLKGKNEKNNS